jgi:hypothetical protein
MMRCRSCWQFLSPRGLVIWKNADILRLLADAGHETRFDEFSTHIMLSATPEGEDVGGMTT